MNLDDKKDPPQKVIKFILNLVNNNNFEDAKIEIKKEVINFPNSSTLYNILGAVFAGESQLNEAIQNYNKSIEINPEYAEAYNNLGIALQGLNKTSEAIESYKKAINLKENFPSALNNLGNAILNLNRPTEALQYFKKALEIKSNYPEAFYNMGMSYQKLGDKDKSLNSFLKAIELKTDYAEAYNYIGLLYFDEGEYEKSLEYFKKSIEIKPNYEKAYNNLGNLLSDLGKIEEAIDQYNKAIKIKNDYARAYSNLLFILNYKINFDLNEYLSEAKRFRLNCGKVKKNLHIKYQHEESPKKLKIGFVSSDFGNHPGGYFTLSTIRELRKKNFELFAYSTFDRNDEIAHHFKPLFYKWNSIENKKEEEVIEQIIKDGIHILIDVQGHSAKNRLPIFFYKAAPIQATWLSQGSNGIPEIDYFIGSPHITPKSEEKYYVEKIFRLPEISQCFTPPDFSLEIGKLPALKNNFITFGCLNKLSKINDEVIKLWSKILLSVDKSKLLLKTRELSNPKILTETLEKFKKFNIDKNRLILKGKSKTRKEVLENYNQIDISLDPFPFQGNTSTCESVWMGVPVITLKGNRYLFHFGESINSNLNMKDWIAKNPEEYVLKAVQFSSNLKELSKIRYNLRDKAIQSPVFNAQTFAEHFSKMLWGFWKEFEKK